jgi:hypothetical protein
MALGCSSYKKLVFVVPNGYIGGLSITQNKNAPAPEIGPEDTITIKFDIKGNALVQNVAFMNTWHMLIMRYENGSQIVWGEGGEDANVQYFNLGNHNGVYRYEIRKRNKEGTAEAPKPGTDVKPPDPPKP